MKKLIGILFLLMGFVVNAQLSNPIGGNFPQPAGSGTTGTLNTFNGGIRVGRGIVNGYYADTTAANDPTKYIKFYPGAQIVTYAQSGYPTGSLWIRNITADTWLYVGVLAAQGLTKSGDNIELGGVIGSPGIFTNQRTINLNRNILHLTNGIAAESDGAFWQFSKRPFSPYQFISSDTVTTDDQFSSIGRPLSGLFARRIVYFNSGIYKTKESYGHYIGQTYSFVDSMVARTDGGDYQQALIAELRIKPRGSGTPQVIRTGHGTGGNLRRMEGISSLVANFYMDGNGTDRLKLNGTGVGVTAYLVHANLATDTINNFVYFQPGNNQAGKVLKSFLFAPSVFNGATDSAFGWFDTSRVVQSYHAGNFLIGPGDSTVTQAKFRVNGSSLHNGWSGYWANIAANYTARSFTDKNYVDSLVSNFAFVVANNSITNAKLAQMAAHTFKGNNTGSTANALDLTATELTAELNTVVGDAGAGGTKGIVPAPGAGDAAALKFLKADGTWAIPAGSGTGADVALSNLSGVTINTPLLPTTDNATDFGSSTKGWKDAYIRRILMKGATSGTAEIKSGPLAQVLQATTLDGTGNIPSVYDVYVRSDETLANSNADQNLFTNAAHNTFAVLANTTYEFDFKIDLTHGATAHITSFGMTPTTATITNIAYNVLGLVTAVNATTQTQSYVRIRQTATTVVIPTGSNATESMEGKGWFTVGATGGFITPQIKFSADPTGTVLLKTGAEFHIRVKGNNTFTESGPWQ